MMKQPWKWYRDPLREGLVPHWRPGDEDALRERVARVWRGRCRPCEEGNHQHKAAKVGPYVLCRCLSCPTLVVET